MNDEIVQIDNLGKRYGDHWALKGITASVRRGDVVGLLGLNGAGKTTLLETILGFSLPSAGGCTLFGQFSPVHLPETQKRRIGFVPQRDELFEFMTGKRYLSLIASFYPQWNTALITRLAEEWQVPLDKRTNALSTGQRQKLSIMAALGHEPELLLLDEPVASLDPRARRQFLREIVDLASTHTRGILFSTHIVSDLERVASRVWLLREGQLVIDDSLDSIKDSSALSLEDYFLEEMA